VRIEDAGPGTSSAFGEIVTTAFRLPADFGAWIAALVGAPGTTCLLALDGDAAVGAAVLVVDGDCAWFGLGATLPGHRGKGAQGALFAERARRARAQGARHLVTETGAPVGDETPGPSYRNMLRAGFAEAELRPNYASSAA
jgi:GNAT superfamily N-acetyltransferase